MNVVDAILILVLCALWVPTTLRSLRIIKNWAVKK